VAFVELEDADRAKLEERTLEVEPEDKLKGKTWIVIRRIELDGPRQINKPRHDSSRQIDR
jgi:hypothetical protein